MGDDDCTGGTCEHARRLDLLDLLAIYVSYRALQKFLRCRAFETNLGTLTSLPTYLHT